MVNNPTKLEQEHGKGNQDGILPPVLRGQEPNTGQEHKGDLGKQGVQVETYVSILSRVDGPEKGLPFFGVRRGDSVQVKKEWSGDQYQGYHHPHDITLFIIRLDPARSLSCRFAVRH